MDDILQLISTLAALTALTFAAVTAFGTLATAAFTGLLWWVAKRALGGTNTQLRLLREQAERDGRPYVTADVVPGVQGAGTWDLVLTNSGRSVALAVKFSFEDWVANGEDDYITENLIRFLKEPQTLMPGAHKRVMWRADAVKAAKASYPPIGAPENGKFLLTYSDELEKEYRSEISFSLSIVGAATPLPQEGSTSSDSAPDEKKSLADINHALRALNIHVGQLRR
ncbi:hypothetical protein [Salinibacterium sp. SWN248]|uniref:hypothetical protein n=1 Tax=Salinibacterium sp. SWN248 TaxID=2792056 RepID=UPI0018CD06AE|nr:hypothetical protein [Salinibacterium sp. SWN248]MBH0025027.1 hypothetical protein [Salinibacterium sp. SWN248]